MKSASANYAVYAKYVVVLRAGIKEYFVNMLNLHILCIDLFPGATKQNHSHPTNISSDLFTLNLSIAIS